MLKNIFNHCPNKTLFLFFEFKYELECIYIYSKTFKLKVLNFQDFSYV